MRRRRALVVYVDLDPTPGVMHTQESAQNVVAQLLRQSIPHYNPIVSLAPRELQPELAEERN